MFAKIKQFLSKIHDVFVASEEERYTDGYNYGLGVMEQNPHLSRDFLLLHKFDFTYEDPFDWGLIDAIKGLPNKYTGYPYEQA